MDMPALNTRKISSIDSAVDPIRLVTSPYIAANVPIDIVDVMTNVPRYSMDDRHDLISTAGSTPKIPPGPATPCNKPIRKDTTLCVVGSRISTALFQKNSFPEFDDCFVKSLSEGDLTTIECVNVVDGVSDTSLESFFDRLA
jgi:hypothetical protein